MNENEKLIQKGDVVMIDAGCKHTIIAETEMTLVEIQLGDEIYIEDKKKFTLN